jgi:hypothetical protein
MFAGTLTAPPWIFMISVTMASPRPGDIPLDGRSTRWDYASIDPARHLLFIAHLGDSEVIAFDTASQRVIARDSHPS